MIYFAIIIGLIPSFAWLLFYLKEDLRPEPKKIIFITFLLGAVATFLVFKIEVSFNDFIIKFGIDSYSPLSFLGLAFIEEFIKFFVVFLFISRLKCFDEPIDAMIYMVTAALGFAAIENIGASFSQLGEISLFKNAFQVVTLRFIGATLLHALVSALVGYYWARGIIAGDRFLFITEGIILASVLHAVFNHLIIIASPIVIPTLFLFVVGILVLYDFEKLKNKRSF